MSANKIKKQIIDNLISELEAQLILLEGQRDTVEEANIVGPNDGLPDTLVSLKDSLLQRIKQKISDRRDAIEKFSTDKNGLPESSEKIRLYSLLEVLVTTEGSGARTEHFFLLRPRVLFLEPGPLQVENGMYTLRDPLAEIKDEKGVSIEGVKYSCIDGRTLPAECKSVGSQWQRGGFDEFQEIGKEQYVKTGRHVPKTKYRVVSVR